MITRETAFTQEGPFWGELRKAIQEGVRDIRTGFDRVSYSHLDPRVEGGGTLAFALQRVLAEAWRVPEGSGRTLDSMVLVGRFEGGRLAVQELPLASWPVLGEIHFAADGPVEVTSRNAVIRRLRVDGGAEILEALFGDAKIPGDLVVISGVAAGDQSDPIIRRAAAAAGAEAGFIALFLYEANAGPVDIGTVGGTVVNGWHPALMASNHMSGNHLSAHYLTLMDDPGQERWYDADFRKDLYEAMTANGVTVTKRGFLEALAEASPLRKKLPPHLTGMFPDAERVFWTLPDGVFPIIDQAIWDESSPFERLRLLAEVSAIEG